MELKSPEVIVDEIDNAYLHEDNETIDIVVNDDEKTFIEELLPFTCPRCSERAIKGNEKLTKNFTEDVNGISLTCKGCSQKLFIHKPVSL